MVFPYHKSQTRGTPLSTPTQNPRTWRLRKAKTFRYDALFFQGSRYVKKTKLSVTHSYVFLLTTFTGPAEPALRSLMRDHDEHAPARLVVRASMNGSQPVSSNEFAGDSFSFHSDALSTCCLFSFFLGGGIRVTVRATVVPRLSTTTHHTQKIAAVPPSPVCEPRTREAVLPSLQTLMTTMQEAIASASGPRPALPTQP